MAPVNEPTYDELAALPPYAVQSVPVAFEDINGHLNIRHYLGIASEGLDDAMLEVGIPKDWLSIGRAVFSAEHHLAYFHELRTGDRVSVRVRMIGRSERAAHVVVYLVDEGRKHVSYVMEEVFLSIDMETRKTTPWTDEVAAGMDKKIAEHAALDGEPHLSGSISLR